MNVIYMDSFIVHIIVLNIFMIKDLGISLLIGRMTDTEYLLLVLKSMKILFDFEKRIL